LSAHVAVFCPTRADLRTGARIHIQRGGWLHPDVLLVEDGEGHAALVKDFAARPAWLRWSFGRWQSQHEARIHRLLDGHPDVPRLLGRIDALAFAIEYRPGVAVTRTHAERFTASFTAELVSAVEGLHARGVVHLDLRHRSNVLAGDDGRPVLIDVGSAIHLSPDHWLGRRLLPALVWIDRRALAKWRRRFASYDRSEDSLAGASDPGATSEGGRGASRPMK
jgi:hypothetical protein